MGCLGLRVACLGLRVFRLRGSGFRVGVAASLRCLGVFFFFFFGGGFGVFYLDPQSPTFCRILYKGIIMKEP